MTTRRFVARLALLAASVALVGCGASTMPEIRTESERLEVARRMISERRYPTAVELLRSYIDANQGSANIDAAIYLLGMAHLGTKEWVVAAGEFERVIRDYPESDSTPSAAFRLGEAMWGQARPSDFDQDNTHRALEQWEQYRRQYPDHWLNAEADRAIDRARSRLATKLLTTGNLYLRLREPRPAKAYFERIVAEYGDTLLLPDAKFGLAMAEEMMGNDAEAIVQLQDIERRFHGRHASRAARERSRIERKSG